MQPQHPHWIFNIKNTPGSLAIMPCPGCKETDLNTSLTQLKDSGITHILTLMTTPELEKFSVDTLPDACGELELNWLHFPIEDDSIPGQSDLVTWQHIKSIVLDAVSHGGKVAVHCKGGSGRAGLCTAMIFLELGYDLDDAMSIIKEVRPNAFKKQIQIEFLKSYPHPIAA